MIILFGIIVIIRQAKFCTAWSFFKLTEEVFDQTEELYKSLLITRASITNESVSLSKLVLSLTRFICYNTVHVPVE